LKNHHQNRAKKPQVRGASLSQRGQGGGGNGASIRLGSTSNTRAVTAFADWIERGRVEQNSTASSAKARSACGGAWPGLSPVSS
jgi:hypothetical protein